MTSADFRERYSIAIVDLGPVENDAGYRGPGSPSRLWWREATLSIDGHRFAITIDSAGGSADVFGDTEEAARAADLFGVDVRTIVDAIEPLCSTREDELTAEVYGEREAPAKSSLS